MADLTYLDKLEAAARAATPGPWNVDVPTDTLHAIRSENGRIIADVGYSGSLDRDAENAAFIAAANPDVVLGLIADLRAALQAQQGDAATQQCGWLYIDDDGHGPFFTESEKYAGRYLHSWKIFKTPPSDGHTCDYTLAYGCCSQCLAIDAALAARREG